MLFDTPAYPRIGGITPKRHNTAQKIDPVISKTVQGIGSERPTYGTCQRCPEYNPVEACWYFTKKDVCRSVFYNTFEDMCRAVSECVRTHRFNNIIPSKYLFRKPLKIENF